MVIYSSLEMRVLIRLVLIPWSTRIHRTSRIRTYLDSFLFCHQTRRDKSVAAEAKYTGGKRWSAHRLELTVLYNLGLGMNNCAWFRKYLRLESEETFEAKLSYYKYDHDAEERRRAQLKAKGWEDVKQAVSCDGDHLLGRMRMWMNASLFVMPCSHSWNQCMANVRAKMGCWGFAFAHVKYTGGNWICFGVLSIIWSVYVQ